MRWWTRGLRLRGCAASTLVTFYNKQWRSGILLRYTTCHHSWSFPTTAIIRLFIRYSHLIDIFCKPVIVSHEWAKAFGRPILSILSNQSEYAREKSKKICDPNYFHEIIFLPRAASFIVIFAGIQFWLRLFNFVCFGGPNIHPSKATVCLNNKAIYNNYISIIKFLLTF